MKRSIRRLDKIHVIAEGKPENAAVILVLLRNETRCLL